ncbi:MAG TPA: TIGR01777 family protein [Bacteroides sp.]|nr:TIGR01777 family protein [Bacteroides sp.]
MKIALAGYNGFLGKRLTVDLPGHDYILLNRELLYGMPVILGRAIEGAHIVINMSGSPINQRWTAANRKKIFKSRHGVNTNLVKAINGLEQKPECFITVSAIGIYESGGIHDEYSSSQGEGFMSSVVQKWEEPLGLLDDRVKHVILRIGMVLGRDGGVMNPFRKVMRLGIAPVMGSGKQMVSFIHIRDLTASIRFIIENRLEGVFNLTSPQPVEHRSFMNALARETGAWLKIRIPAWMLKLVMGEMHILLTEGQHVIPSRLTEEGFRFMYPGIDQAIKNLVQEI